MLTRARNWLSDADLLTRLRSESGFTLIELMTTMGMMTVAMTAAFLFYSSAVGRTTDTEARVNALADLRVLGERMSRDVRESSTICAPLPAPSANVLYLSGPPDLDAISGTSSCVATRMVIYNCATTPGTCTRSEGGATPETVAEGLSTTTSIFTKTADNYVSIYLEKLPDDRAGAITLQRGAALRNYCEGGC